jgi:hypothetical protein
LPPAVFRGLVLRALALRLVAGSEPVAAAPTSSAIEAPDPVDVDPGGVERASLAPVRHASRRERLPPAWHPPPAPIARRPRGPHRSHA